MRKLTKLTIGAAGLVLSFGTAVADVPQEVAGNDFDQYTVDAGGFIQLDNAGGTYGCPIGGTCTVLEATGPGILQQKVEYAGDGTFYQTIIVEDGAVSVADPTTLPFRMENYVDAGNTGGAANLATLSVITEGAPGDFDYMVTEFEGQQGTLIGADPTSPIGTRTGESIHQLNANNTGRQTEFFYEDGGGAGKRMGINMQNPNNEGQFTLRRVTGYFADSDYFGTAGPQDGTLTLDSGDFFDYTGGTNLQVVYLTQAASGTGAAFDRVLGLTIVSELADNEGDGGVILQEIRQDNNDGSGNFVVTGGAAGTQLVGAGPFMDPWETDLFGAEPRTYDSNGAGGVATPGAGYWDAPPPWNVLVP